MAFVFLPLAQGNTPDDALQRMKARLSVIDSMKAAGEVGENASGYLAPRVELAARKESIVEAENSDRRTLYLSVANKTGQTVEEVGANRALRIAKIAKNGVWLQAPDGSWYRK